MDGTVEKRRQLLLTSIADAIDMNAASLAGKRLMISLATVMIGGAFALLGIAQLLSVTQ
jgi:hypothetical protein